MGAHDRSGVEIDKLRAGFLAVESCLPTAHAKATRDEPHRIGLADRRKELGVGPIVDRDRACAVGLIDPALVYESGTNTLGVRKQMEADELHPKRLPA